MNNQHMSLSNPSFLLTIFISCFLFSFPVSASPSSSPSFLVLTKFLHHIHHGLCDSFGSLISPNFTLSYTDYSNSTLAVVLSKSSLQNYCTNHRVSTHFFPVGDPKIYGSLLLTKFIVFDTVVIPSTQGNMKCYPGLLLDVVSTHDVHSGTMKSLVMNFDGKLFWKQLVGCISRYNISDTVKSFPFAGFFSSNGAPLPGHPDPNPMPDPDDGIQLISEFVLLSYITQQCDVVSRAFSDKFVFTQTYNKSVPRMNSDGFVRSCQLTYPMLSHFQSFDTEITDDPAVTISGTAAVMVWNAKLNSTCIITFGQSFIVTFAAYGVVGSVLQTFDELVPYRIENYCEPQTWN